MPPVPPPVSHCPQCGQAFASGARYCSHCGATVAGMPPPPPPNPYGQPMPPPPVETRPRPDTGTAEVLILAGAALSLVLPILMTLVLLAFGAAFTVGGGPFGAFPGAVFAFFALFLLILGAVWALVAWYARNRIREGDLETGGLIALVAGGLMLFTGHFLSGPLVLIGGVMAWSRR